MNDRRINSYYSSSQINGTGEPQITAFTLKAKGTDVAKLLECPVCYDIILPPIILCKSSHSVCNSCRKKLQNCPVCRGEFSQVRNLFAEHLLEKCLIRCKYHDAGCNVLLPGKRLVEHQLGCELRPIYCQRCKVDVPYALFLEHLTAADKLQRNPAPEISTGFVIRADQLLKPAGARHSMWLPTWMHAFGKDFFCFLETSQNQWWIWVGGYGTQDICDQFVCSVAVWNEEKRTEMKYVGKIHQIRATKEEVLESGQCLIMMDANLKDFIDRDGINVLVQISRGYEPPKTIHGTPVESPLLN